MKSGWDTMPLFLLDDPLMGSTKKQTARDHSHQKGLEKLTNTIIELILYLKSFNNLDKLGEKFKAENPANLLSQKK